MSPQGSGDEEEVAVVVTEDLVADGEKVGL